MVIVGNSCLLKYGNNLSVNTLIIQGLFKRASLPKDILSFLLIKNDVIEKLIVNKNMKAIIISQREYVETKYELISKNLLYQNCL